MATTGLVIVTRISVRSSLQSQTPPPKPGSGSLQRQVRFLRRPIYDGWICAPQEMSKILDTIDSLLAEGHNVYLHCWSGTGRTGLVVGCWLVRHGLSGREALRKIRALRKRDDNLQMRSSPQTLSQRQMVQCWRSLSKHLHQPQNVDIGD